MSEEYKPKIGDKVLVKPKANRDDKPVPLIPYPPRAKGHIRYLAKGQFTRVRFDAYLESIFDVGNLEVKAIEPAEPPKDDDGDAAKEDPPAKQPKDDGGGKKRDPRVAPGNTGGKKGDDK